MPIDQARQRRLADPAEAEGGERDAELGGGDVAVERLYGTAGQPSFAVAGLGQSHRGGSSAHRPARTPPPRRRRWPAPAPRRRRGRGGSEVTLAVPYASTVTPMRSYREAAGMIRRLAVPPFEALDPCCRSGAGSDPATREAVAAHPRRRARARGRGRPGVHPAVRRCRPAARRVGAGPRRSGRGRWSESTPRSERPSHWRWTGCGNTTSTSGKRGSRSSRDDGSVVGMKVTPLDRVGLYIPGGKASYPSSVVMNAVPAVVAGVQEIVAVVPPTGVTDVGAGRLRPLGRHPHLPDRRRPGGGRAGVRHGDRAAGWTRSWGPATAGWRRPSGRWSGRWAST